MVMILLEPTKLTKHISNIVNEMVRKTSIRSIAKRVRTLEKEVELKVNSTKKYTVDHSALTTVLTDTSPTWSLLNGLTQGSNNYERVGREVNATSVRVSGLIYPTSGGTTVGYFSRVRIMIVRDKLPNGSAINLYSPLSSSIKPPIFNCGSVPYYPTTFANYNSATEMWNQYDVLADTHVDLKTQVGGIYGASDTPFSVNCQAYFDVKVPLNCRCEYAGGTTNGISSISKNSIYVIFIADTNGELTVLMDDQFWYKDA